MGQVRTGRGSPHRDLGAFSTQDRTACGEMPNPPSRASISLPGGEAILCSWGVSLHSDYAPLKGLPSTLLPFQSPRMGECGKWKNSTGLNLPRAAGGDTEGSAPLGRELEGCPALLGSCPEGWDSRGAEATSVRLGYHTCSPQGTNEPLTMTSE